MNKTNINSLRTYYVSQDIIDTLICQEDSIDCYVESKKGCEVITLQSFIEKTDSEVGRHDLAILYKRLYLKNHTFQLGLDFVDYGAGGLNYADENDEIKISRNDLLKDNSVIIYGLDEKDDTNTIFFEVEVEFDDIEEQQEIKTKSTSIDIELIKRQISNGDLIILPIKKETNEYNGIFFERDSDVRFTFHERYVPTLYSRIEHVLSDKVSVPKDFTLYEFFIMKKDIETDKLGNSWIILSYKCSLSSLDLIELDTTGKTHMYILDNFKDVDKNSIYESFMKLDKEKISYDTMIRIIEKVHPSSTKWFEDLIIDRIKGNYICSETMSTIVKYIRVSKKSKDRDIAKFLNMMLNHSGSCYIDGYVRILKALNLKDDELKKYVDIIIEKDKERESMGGIASDFILFWNNKTFKDIEDYLYLGMQTQDIHPPCGSSSLFDDIEEKRNRKGLNTDYDFVKSYLRLIRAKSIDKVELIKRYMQGIEMDNSHFKYEKLLDSLHSYISSNDKGDLSDIVPLFVDCIVKYDKYGEFAKKYLPQEKLKKVSSYFSSFSYYREEFEPYVDTLFEVVTVGQKIKDDEKWKLL